MDAFNWDDLRFMLALSKHGTMSAAADALNANVATVSRRIEKARQVFGTPLFVRSADRWVATDAARRLLEVAEDFEGRLATEQNSKARMAGRGLVGQIRLAAPTFFNTFVLVPAVHRLLAQHPALTVELQNRSWGEGLGEADVMIRIGRPETGRLVARRLMRMSFRAYRSVLAPPTDGWIAMSPGSGQVPQLQYARELFDGSPAVVVGLFEQKLTLMRSTGLAAILADNVAQHLPDMQPVPEVAERSVPAELWMAYHMTRREDLSIRTVTDWVIEAIDRWRGSAIREPAEILAPPAPPARRVRAS